jgi:hypothetical protein
MSTPATPSNLEDTKRDRRCVICGASVRNMNPKCNTCSPDCTKAKHAGLTLAEFYQRENSRPIETEDIRNRRIGSGCEVCGCRFCICKEI